MGKPCPNMRPAGHVDVYSLDACTLLCFREAFMELMSRYAAASQMSDEKPAAFPGNPAVNGEDAVTAGWDFSPFCHLFE